jgi:hypothetical protein
MSLNLDPWWDEPAYQAARGSFSTKGTFILYRDEVPDPADITKFEWETILRFVGASQEEIADVQKRMGRVWR